MDSKPCRSDHGDYRDGCRVCFLARTREDYARLWSEPWPPPPLPDGVAAMWQPPPKTPVTMPPPKEGPGAELKRLLESLGFVASAGCGCNSMAARMNAWGVTGCAEHRAEILTWLRQQQAKLGWLDKVRAGVLAAWTGLAFKVDRHDPAPGLLKEAIKRAEAKHDKA